MFKIPRYYMAKYPFWLEGGNRIDCNLEDKKMKY